MKHFIFLENCMFSWESVWKHSFMLDFFYLLILFVFVYYDLPYLRIKHFNASCVCLERFVAMKSGKKVTNCNSTQYHFLNKKKTFHWLIIMKTTLYNSPLVFQNIQTNSPSYRRHIGMPYLCDESNLDKKIPFLK